MSLRSHSVHRALMRAVVLAAGAVLIAALVLGGAGGRSIPAPTMDDSAMRGLQLWRRHNCGACHAIYGLGGHQGPDLTNVARRRDGEYVHHALCYGVGAMPSPGLSDVEADDLSAFLRHVDGLGIYPPNSPRAPVYGVHP